MRLAKFYANPHAGDRVPVQKVWSKAFNWGSHRIKGGVIKPSANAWASNIVWGTSADTDVTWGVSGEDTVVYSDEVFEPLPNPALEFGDVPQAGQTTTTTTSTTTTTDPVTGVSTTTVSTVIL